MLQERKIKMSERSLIIHSSRSAKPSPFQLHLVVLLRPPPPRARLERLAQQRFGFGLHLPEQDEAVFVEFLAAGLGLDGGDAVLDFAEVVDDLADAQGSRLVYYIYALCSSMI
jgi:hypothetical protein